MSDIRYRRKMELLTTIKTASELTGQLYEQMDSSGRKVWEDIMSRRALAMEQLEDAHRNASQKERDTCCDELKQLHRDDELLREKSENILGKLSLEIRERLGKPSSAGHAVGGEALQACLDRKA